LNATEHFNQPRNGSKDRATGHPKARDVKTGHVVSTLYALKCRPAQRMF
jgi:hypothetical protein